MTKTVSKNAAAKTRAKKPAKSKVSKAPAKSRTAIVVLGMHRSGTSALAGLLNVLGCDAPLTPMAPTPDNEKGYFESAPIYGFHEKLLNSAASAWDDWLELNPSWFKSARKDEYHDSAVALLGQEFGASRLFVLKDPRQCRLVPFWEDVMKSAQVAPRYVLTHRNPQEVAASLAKRDGMDAGIGMLIWLRHVLQAEVDTRGKTRCFVSYQQVLSDWRAVARKVEKQLDVPLPRAAEGAAPEVEDHLDPNLRHQNIDTLHRPAVQAMSDWVRDVHEIIERWVVSGEDKADYKTLDAILAAFNATGSTFGSIVYAARQIAEASVEDREKVKTLQAERDRIDADLTSTTADRDDAIAKRDAGAEAAQELCHQLNALKKEGEDQAAALSEAQQQAASAKTELETFRRVNSSLRASMDATVTGREVILTDLAKARKERSELVDRVSTLTSEHEAARAKFLSDLNAGKEEKIALSQKLSTVISQRDLARQKHEADVAAADKQQAVLRENLSAVTAERDAVQKKYVVELAAAKDQHAALNKSLSDVTAERDAARVRHAAELAAAKDQHAALTQNLATLTAAQEAATVQYAADMAAAQEQHAELSARLSEVMAERDTLREKNAADLAAAVQERAALNVELGALRAELDAAQAKQAVALAQAKDQRAALDRQISDTIAQRDAAQQAVADLTEQGQALRDEVSSFAAEREGLSADLSSAAKDRDRLQVDLADVVKLRDDLQQNLNDAQAENITLRQSVSESEARLEALEGTLAGLKDDLAQAQSALKQRTHEAEQTHKELAALKDKQTERDRRYVELKATLSQRDAAVQEQENQIKALTLQISEKEDRTQAVEATLKTQYRELADLTRILRESEAQVKGAYVERDAQENRALFAEAAVTSYSHSTSWRITSPLRWLAEKLRN